MQLTGLRPALAAAVAILLSSPAAAFDEADALFGGILSLCGEAFAGKVVTDDPRDKDMASALLVMHVAKCTKDELRIPFHVGEDRSRTWVITRIEGGRLRLKHDHRHEDGTPDAVTMYGGDSTPPGTAGRQEFPADAYSKEMFLKNGLAVSVDNVWAIEVTPSMFAYELRREGRFFRIEFDITKPVEAPPPPWGSP